MSALATLPFVSVEEYLSTRYRPDREYIDGAVEETTLGEYERLKLQAFFTRLFGITRLPGECAFFGVARSGCPAPLPRSRYYGAPRRHASANYPAYPTTAHDCNSFS